MKSLNRLEIWRKLSLVPVAEYIETKNGFDYLSWSRAWALLMNEFPEAEFCFGNNVVFADETMEVSCTVSIGEFRRTSTLAVMDYRNKAIANPSATDIQNAKQRCFVKAIALHGLGFSLYLGEQVETTLVGSDQLLDQIATVVDRDHSQTFLSWNEFRRFVKNAKGADLGELPHETVERLLKWLKSPNAKDVGSWPGDFLEAYNASRLEGS